MSFYLLHRVLDEEGGLIATASELALAMVLASWANDEGEVVYQDSAIGMRELARILRLSDERSVRRVIQRLEASGVLTVVRNPDGGRGARNSYAINVSLLENAPSRKGSKPRKKGDKVSPIIGDGERGTRGTEKGGQGGHGVPLQEPLKGKRRELRDSPPNPRKRGDEEKPNLEQVKHDWREITAAAFEPMSERPTPRQWARRMKAVDADRETLRAAMRASGGRVRRGSLTLDTSLYHWLEPSNVNYWAAQAGEV